MAGQGMQRNPPARRRDGVTAFVRRGQRLLWLGLAAIGLGLSLLLVYAWVEVVNNPGITLADGYWIGRVPWTPAGIALVLAGSVIALVAGAAVVAARGDWLRRFLIVPAFVLPVLWWAVGLGLLPFPRFRGPDPVTLAYSLPEGAALSLILPAIVVVALALLPMRPDDRHFISPVHDRDPASPDDERPRS